MTQPDGEATEEVDQHDDDAGQDVTLHELRGTVHCTVEFGFGGDALSFVASLVLVDQTSAEIGVDRHLLARHGVEGETGRDLGDTSCTVGHHGELDDDEDEEDHQPHDDAATHHESAEGLDDPSGVAVDEDQARRADVQGQSGQGHDEEQGWEDRQVEGVLQRHDAQQHQHREGDVEGQEQIKDDRRHGDHHHHHGAHHEQRQQQAHPVAHAATLRRARRR